MENRLKEFLIMRGLSSQSIEQMENEKITMDTIKLLDPETMEKFIPKIGDRLAVLDFCSRNEVSQMNRKGSLLEKLRSKLNKHKFESEGFTSSKKKSSATKPTRVIDIGWMHSVDGRLVQMRSKQGGGTRKVSVNKNTKPEEILDIGKKLFFIDDMSKQGHISEFTFILCDFKCQEITDNLTVEEMFQLTHLSNLRFYITTFQKHKEKPSTKTTQKNSSTDDNLILSHSDESEETPYLVKNLEQSICSRSRNKSKIIVSNEIKSLERAENIELFFDDDFNDIIYRETSPVPVSVRQSFYLLDNSEDKTGSNSQPPQENKSDEIVQLVRPSGFIVNSVGSQYNEYSNSPDWESSSLIPDDFELPSSQASGGSNSNTDDIFTIVIHRGNVVEDLIRQFVPMPVHVRNSIKLEVYLPNGELEKAADIGGVFRDILSEFWQEFSDKYTLGTQARVPVLRHDFNNEKWTAVAKILAKGWKDERYFPCQISKCFMEACIFNEVQSDLIKDLFNFVSEMDSKILRTAFYSYTDVDVDDLLDCLENLECKWRPNEHNIKRLITDLAHKELIQKSTFIINQWYPVLKSMLKSDEVENIYGMQKNLNKFVIKALAFDENLCEAQLKVLNFLKKFIRESDRNILSNLLRFVTGSNMLIPDTQIVVKFVESSSDFCRTPTAHTCARILSLPSSYESYPDFRHEIRSLLTSEVWIMDIV